MNAQDMRQQLTRGLYSVPCGYSERVRSKLDTLHQPSLAVHVTPPLMLLMLLLMLLLFSLATLSTTSWRAFTAGRPSQRIVAFCASRVTTNLEGQGDIRI